MGYGGFPILIDLPFAGEKRLRATNESLLRVQTFVVLLVALAWIGSSAWCAKLIFCLAMVGFFGTFPRPRINITCFVKEWFVFFVPVGATSTNLADIVQIETDLDEKIGMTGGILIFFFFGLFDLIMIWLFDWLIPWFGGDYKLWLRTKSDQRVLVWQGNGESNFRRNLALLKDLSGLPVTRG